MRKRRGPKPALDRNDWQRATFFVRKKHLTKIKDLAYWDRRKIKEIIDEALGTYLKAKRIKTIKRRVK